MANQRLRWETILDYLGGAKVIRRILQTGRWGVGPENQCCRGERPLLASKMEGGTMNQGMWAVSRRRERQEADSLLEPLERHSAADT